MFFEGRGSKTLVKPMFWRSRPFLKHRSSRGFKKKVGPWGGGGTIYIYIYLYLYIDIDIDKYKKYIYIYIFFYLYIYISIHMC